MSIEMNNPESLPGKIDAAWNCVEQIGLALNIGDVPHAKKAKEDAARLLSLAMDEAGENEYDGPGLIRAERHRQLTEKKWTAAHDDEHTEKELVRNALDALQSYLNGPGNYAPDPASDKWEIGRKRNNEPQRLLEIAGALIAAEIERKQRIEMRDDES